MPAKLQITQTLIVAPWVFLTLENHPAIYFFSESSTLPNILSYASENGPPKELASLGSGESAALLALVKEKVLFFPLSPSPGQISNNSIVFQGQTIARIATSDQQIFLQLDTSVGPVVAIFSADKKVVGQFRPSGQIIALIGLAQGVLVQTDSGVTFFNGQGKELAQLPLSGLEKAISFDQHRKVALQQASTVTILDGMTGQTVGQILEDRPINDIVAVADRIVLLSGIISKPSHWRERNCWICPLITKGNILQFLREGSTSRPAQKRSQSSL